MAIKNSKKGKSPGPDCYTMLYYKIFEEKLILKMCNYINKLEGQIRQESLLAHIAIIPKEDKDPLLCSNFRPIALLNTDIK